MATSALVPIQPVFLSSADKTRLAEMEKQRIAFNEQLEARKAALAQYNPLVERYNQEYAKYQEAVAPYNEAAAEYNRQLAQRQAAVDEYNRLYQDYEKQLAEFKEAASQYDQGALAEYQKQLKAYEATFVPGEKRGELALVQKINGQLYDALGQPLPLSEPFTQYSKVAGMELPENVYARRTGGELTQAYRDALKAYQEARFTRPQLAYHPTKGSSYRFEGVTDVPGSYGFSTPEQFRQAGYTLVGDPSKYWEMTLVRGPNTPAPTPEYTFMERPVAPTYGGPAAPVAPVYAGPAEPVKPEYGGIAEPTRPVYTGPAEPVAPFTQESFEQFQQEAQGRAQQAAGQRALAAEVYQDPSKFGLAGFAGLSARAFAKGGEVRDDEPRTKAGRMMKELGFSKPPKEKTLADEPSRQSPETLAYSLRAQSEANKDADLRRKTLAAPGALEVKRFQAGGEVMSPEEQPVVEESSASRALKEFIRPVREGVQGYFGLDSGGVGSEAYRVGQAMGNMPGVGLPAMAVAGTAKAVGKIPASKRLLLMPCSDMKCETPAEAKDLYKGVFYQTYRKQVQPGAEPHMMILSAKHGFVGPKQILEPYDQKMTPQQAEELAKSIKNSLTNVDWPEGIEEVMLVGGKHYQRVMNAALDELKAQGKLSSDVSVRSTKGEIGEQRSQLGQYLREMADRPPEFSRGGEVTDFIVNNYQAGGEVEGGEEVPQGPITTPLRTRTRRPATQEENESLSRAMLQGLANLPYNVVGIPGDIANLLAAPTGKQPFYGSESAKALATQFGIRPAPPTDPTAAALYGAADIGSSLINPAAPVRAAARSAERAGAALSNAAKDFQEYNRMLDVPGASYAVRPEGSQLVIRRDNNPDWVGQLLDDGLRDARYVTPIGAAPERVALMENFWNNKAANYFAKQFGTESDPIYRGIRDQYIKSPRLAKDFPDYVLDQLSVGKTRVDAATGQSRFFPKYPAAYDAMRAKYDELTQIHGVVPARDPSQVMDPDYTYSSSRQGTELLDDLKNREIDRMIAQGTPVSQADPSLKFLTRSVKTPDTILGPYNAKSILQDYEKATGTRLGDPNFQGVPEPEALPQNLRTAFDKGEIMYGTSGPNAPLRQLFDTNSINEFLKTLSDRELKNVRFEDAVKGGAKVSAKRQERETLAADIRAGKRVPDRIFSEGVSAPLLQFNEGPLAGFAWKRIEKAEATVPEGAYLGHSVGGYAEGGAYGPGKHRDFNEGRSQVYTLRDNRNRPVTTVEVSMRDIGPIVTQIKGNGRATGNTAPVKYDEAVLQFFKDYLKPVRIAESEDYLTPLLKQYKQQFVANMKDGGEVTSNDAFIAKHQAGGEAKSGEPQVTGISRLVDFIAQRLSPESFPTAARTLLESAQGKKDPITEASFSKDELEVLRRLTKTDKGRVNYEDYSRLAEQLRQEGQSGADATPSLFSLGSPVGNVRNTLGRFTYTRDPQGNVVVVDKYDFNPPVSGQTQESRTSDYGVFGPYNVIREYAGQKLPPGKGRDVRINLVNPVPQANGSTRNN